MSSFQEVQIGDVCSVGDGAHSKVKRVEEGVPYLTSKNIGQGNLKLEKLDYISEESFEKLFPLNSKATRRPRVGDVLFGIIGTFGNAYLYKEKDYFGFSSSIGILRPDPEILDSAYLYYVLSSNAFKCNHANHNAGSVQGYTNIPTVKSLPIPLPPLAEQKKIAKILKSLDDKIELNTQTNQTLEQIAQAIFKSWFVDFDPVKAKIAVLEAGGTAEQAELAAMSAISAKDEAALKQLQAEQPEAYAELAQTAALFPSKMVDSELGEIPEGWKVSKLASCTTELRRGISPKYVEDGGVSVINQKCIRNHTIDFTLARRHDSSKRKIEGREIEIGDVLVNSTGVGTLGRLSPVRYLDEVSVVDSHVTVVRADISEISKSFLAGLMIENESFIEASGAGSTGQTELRKQVLEDIIFTHPPRELDQKFNVIASKINRQIAELEKQKSTLACCRDSLLPKLLSGELPIPESDEANA